MTTPTLGPSPADPSTISFERRCFVQDGTEVYWTVSQSWLASGPKRFDNEAAAVAYGRKVKRPITRHEAPRMVRVSWT